MSAPTAAPAPPTPAPRLDSPAPLAATAIPSAMSAAHILALQQTAGNARVAQWLSRSRPAVLSRQLDVFKSGGKGTDADLQTCLTFAATVSAFVDQAHRELMRGTVKEWTGAKFTAFHDFLLAGHTWAGTHAGNAIEERVYALMNADGMGGVEWTAQYAEGMGSASRPDIVINLSSGQEGLIDITS